MLYYLLLTAYLLYSTVFNTYTSVTSQVGFSLLRSRIETFGINRVKLAVERARASLTIFLDLLSHPTHRRSLLSGHPPPLSAMLAPALSESALRWEELGSGFSGHGFDDRQPEHYAIPDLANVPVKEERRKGWIAEWAREQRGKVVLATSEQLKGVRSRWFGWRLRMKEVEHPDQTQPARSNEDGQSSSSNETASDQSVQAQQPEKKRKSWVWEWSRNNKP